MRTIKKEIVKNIMSMSGKYAPYNIFSDWVELMALTIQNQCCLFRDNLWKKREEQYLDIAKRYTHDELIRFGDMLGMLVQIFAEGKISDVLGEIYMEAGLGNKNTGQFFTPYHLSLMCAKMALSEEPDSIIEVNEPSCGGGGMIIGMAAALNEKGIDYSRRMRVVAQDLDWKSVYMTYVQLSLLGINAKVVQGNTLGEPYIKGYPNERVLITPAGMGVLV